MIKQSSMYFQAVSISHSVGTGSSLSSVGKDSGMSTLVSPRNWVNKMRILSRHRASTSSVKWLETAPLVEALYSICNIITLSFRLNLSHWPLNIGLHPSTWAYPGPNRQQNWHRKSLDFAWSWLWMLSPRSSVSGLLSSPRVDTACRWWCRWCRGFWSIFKTSSILIYLAQKKSELKRKRRHVNSSSCVKQSSYAIRFAWTNSCISRVRATRRFLWYTS